MLLKGRKVSFRPMKKSEINLEDRMMQFSMLPHSIAIIQFYFKTISIFLKNKLLILPSNF